MNPTDLALEAAAMIMSSGSGDAGRIADFTLPQARRVANDLTATAQTIYTIAPAIYKRPLGADFGAPVTSTLTAMNGSDVVTTAYAFGEGCSVFVGGIMNEIRTEDGVKRLRFPFTGSSGAQSAVFYRDCVVLDESVARVLGPVSIAGNRCPLIKLNNRAQAEEFRRRTGAPTHYWVEPVLLGSANQVSTLRLRVLPIPMVETVIGYDVALRAPKFTVDDLGTDMTPSTKSLVVPMEYHELLFRPIFLQFFAGSAWFPSTAELRKRLAEDDRAARMFLRDYKPQQESNRFISAM